MGARLPKCSSPSFLDKVEEALPTELREALLPLVRLAEELSDCIKDYDEKIEKLGREKYGHAELLRQVKGVGPLTSLAYVLTLENPDRFRKSRDVVVPRTSKGGAVVEMEGGPLRSAYRGGSQTAGCC
jgi:transposase